MYQNLWNTAKVGLTENCIALNTDIKKEEKFQIQTPTSRTQKKTAIKKSSRKKNKYNADTN